MRKQDKAVLSSIQDVETGETRVFASLELLNEWLRRETKWPVVTSDNRS
jgi:hypothetical protein